MAAKFLYFANSATSAMTFPVDNLLAIDQLDNASVVMTFEHALGTAGSNTKVDMTVNPGTGKTVMQSISEAIAFSKDQFVVIADSVNNNFINSNITAVSVDDSGATNNGLTAGAGITSGTDTVYHSWVEKNGNIIKTSIYIDLDGLGSSATADDIVGVGTDPAHIGQITAAQNGTIFAGQITTLETPTTNLTDIDLASSATGTLAFDDAVTSPTVLVNTGGVSANTIDALTAFPAANDFLYITSATTTAVTEAAAGRLLIELFGTE
mgnify:CR=1 FL=1|tara:strand:- start:419 stop:1216 length:798 start_codon:yes stop_codon:yes gene_type:complete